MSTKKRSYDGSTELEKLNVSCSKRIRLASINTSEIVSYNPIIRSGKIRMIRLENFMCHEKLKFEFDNRINFVVGRNGSGKSAIMTAIVLALGGTARSTNRSTNIQKFIKTGENAAKIEIELENRGSKVFKYDVYGEKITIIRIIRLTGSSSYTLKDCSGRVVSTKLDDLRQMLLFFSIRIDNPIFMLNQDKAREFLKELEPKKNYELFLKASLLDTVNESLESCRVSYSFHTSQLSFLESYTNTEKKKIEEMKEKLEIYNNAGIMKELLKEKEISYVWCSVVALEKEIKEMEEIVSKIDEKFKSLNEYASSKDTVTKTLKDQLIEKQKILHELEEQYNENDKSLHLAKEEVNRIDSQIRIIQSNISCHMKRIDYEKMELRQLDSHMQNIDENKSKADELMETNQQNIQKLNEKLEENKVVLENGKRDLVILRNNLEQLREKKSELKQETDIILKQINGITGHLSTLKINACNKLAIYGRNIVALVADIEKMYREGKFSEMPRGPVGSYIKVPDEKFRNVVEHVLKSRLNSFIVNSNKDRFTLNELIKNKHPHVKSPIITTTFSKQVYNVSKGRVQPPTGSTLLMDELICSDATVMNLLIDTLRIETILITDSKIIAEELTSSLENVPPNLSRVVVPKHGLEYVAAPHYAMYSQKIGMASLLQVDVNDRIRQLAIEKSAAEQKATSLQNSLRDINRNLEEQEMKYREKRSLIATREQSIRQILGQKEELENYVYPHVPDFVILQNEYKEIEEKIENFNQTLHKDKIKLDKIISEKNDKVQQMEIMKKSFIEHDIKQKQQKKDCDNLELQLRNIDHTMKQNEHRIHDIKVLLKTKENELQKKQKEYDKKKALALAKGEYIPTDRTEEQLSKEIRILQIKIQQYDALCIDPKKLAEDLERKNVRLKEKYGKIRQLNESIKLLLESSSIRCQTLKRLLRHVATCVQHVFTAICKFRNIDGNLDINHDTKTINIEVTPRANQQHPDYRMSTTRVLSGGERSFTTVALLTALWAATNHPFYFLDEYDVFTDEVYRHYITKVLIQEGERNPNRQYFFLTPQDTTINEESDAVKIHKLAPPVRT